MVSTMRLGEWVRVLRMWGRGNFSLSSEWKDGLRAGDWDGDVEQGVLETSTGFLLLFDRYASR
jgi:hypothetical protein